MTLAILPQEIIDNILLFVNDIGLCFQLENYYCIKKIYNKDIHTWDWASETGNLQFIRWLHTDKSEGPTTKAMDYAATNGHLNVVKFLHINRSEGCTNWIMSFARCNGHDDIVNWLYDNIDFFKPLKVHL